MSLFIPPNYIIGTPRIKVSTDINYIPNNLLLGELAYGFDDNTLFIGSPDSNLPTVIISDNKINNLIATYFDDHLTAHISSLLTTKADLTHSNVFIGMNEFPYLHVSDSAPAQRNLPVTIRMVKEFMQETLASLGLLQNVTVGIYQFLDEPLKEIVIQHNKHTLNFDVVEVLEAETNNYHKPEIETLDDNSFKLIFSYSILLSLIKVIFYV